MKKVLFAVLMLAIGFMMGVHAGKCPVMKGVCPFAKPACCDKDKCVTKCACGDKCACPEGKCACVDCACAGCCKK